MQKPKVSVIMPVYNTEQYLHQSLDSILGQSLKDIEVICADDGSTDGSLHLLQEYASHDSRMVVLKSQHGNLGPGAIRNMALNKAGGEYIAFVDSDDYIHLEMLKELYDTGVCDNADVVMCAIKKFTANPEDQFQKCVYDRLIPAVLDDVSFTWVELQEILFELRFACWNKIYKKTFLDTHQIKFSEGIFYEDLIFTYQALLRAEKMRFVRKELYYNRKHRQGSTTFTQGARAYGAFAAMSELESLIRQNPDLNELIDRFSAFRFTKLLKYLPKNDAAHIGKYYQALKAIAGDPALASNCYLSDNKHKTIAKIKDCELLEFLVFDYWDTKTNNAKLQRQAAELKDKNTRLKDKNAKLKAKNSDLKTLNKSLAERRGLIFRVVRKLRPKK